MTNSITTLLGAAFAAGLNIYATVLALAAMHRFDILHLPEGMALLASTPVMIVAGVLYAIEFVADKVPIVDSIWDVINTFLRPAAGALLAYGIVGAVEPQWQIIAALVGGGVALTSHVAKASTRAAANVSPEPFSNWFLSIAEDLLVFVVMWLVGNYPVAASIVVVLLIGIAVAIIWTLSRFARRVFRRAPYQREA
jgi:hypothetical protein